MVVRAGNSGDEFLGKRFDDFWHDRILSSAVTELASGVIAVCVDFSIGTDSNNMFTSI